LPKQAELSPMLSDEQLTEAMSMAEQFLLKGSTRMLQRKVIASQQVQNG
jgi:hypothetical protein